MLIKDNALGGMQHLDDIEDAVLLDDADETTPDAAVDAVADDAEEADEADEAAPTEEGISDIPSDDDEPNDQVADESSEPEENSEASETKGRRSLMEIIKRDLPVDTAMAVITGEFLRKQNTLSKIRYILLLALIAVVYITNRYYSEQSEVDLIHLQKEMTHQRTLSLVQFTRLTGMSRQSELERRLRQMGDTTLTPPHKPPFIIHVNTEK